MNLEKKVYIFIVPHLQGIKKNELDLTLRQDSWYLSYDYVFQFWWRAGRLFVFHHKVAHFVTIGSRDNGAAAGLLRHHQGCLLLIGTKRLHGKE